MLNYYRIFVISWFAIAFPIAAAADTVCFNCHKKEAFIARIVHQP